MRNRRLKFEAVLFCILLTGSGWSSETPAIVAPEQSISDESARLFLIKSLVKTANGRSEAVSHLDVLLQGELDARMLQEIADVKISLGHYRAGFALYKHLMSLPDSPGKVLEEALAERRILWGDFHGAEEVWRERLDKRPDDHESALLLGAALAGADRYDEAKAVYRKLWFRFPHHAEAGLELAKVLMHQRKFDEASGLAMQFKDFPGHEKSARILLGEALQALGELAAAENIFSRLAEDELSDADDWARLGVVQLKRGSEELASDSFSSALGKDPQHIEAAFRKAGNRAVDTDGFIQKVFRAETSPARLKIWAELYTMEGFHGRALECYEQAITIDPDYFPGAEGNAFVLAIIGEHGRSAEMYRELLKDFPESRRLNAGLGRALAWGREYEKSLEVYDSLIEKRPEDLVLKREAARVALWGKMFDDAMARYDEILTPGVDGQLFYALQPHAGEFAPRLKSAMSDLSELKEKEPGHEGYRQWLDILENDAVPGHIADILYSLYGRYEIQRAVFHEREYKRLQSRHRYARALTEVSRLIDLTPGDQEAVFDRAQIACVQGLCDSAREDYKRLLRIDPAHSIAAEALELARIDQRPGLRLSGSYWREQGRSGISDLRRRTHSVGLEVPVYCRTRFFMDAQRLSESPGGYGGSIRSWSQTLGWDGVLNPYFRGELSLTRKSYDLSRFEDSRTGRASLWANLNDIARLGAGFERSDELYNRFGFEQGIQSDSFWLGLQSDLTRRLDAGIRFRDTSYSDDNYGRSLRMSAGYEFTDHPGIFKAELSGEYRDTRHRSRSIFDAGDNLVDIIHPYWTPQDYTGVFLTLEWRHDISGPHQYCGNRRHFYDLKATVGTDSESNPGITLEAEWQRRFTSRWSVELHGYAHRSPEWDASGARLFLGYRF